MSEDKPNKKVKVYTKDNFTFTGILIHIDSDFLQIKDIKSDKEKLRTFALRDEDEVEEYEDD